MRFIIYLIIGFLSAALSDPVYAETLRVFPGEYVITQSARFATFRNESAPAAHRTIRSLGRGAALVERSAGVRAAFRRHEAVKFDPEDTFCAELLAAGSAESCSPNFELRSFGSPQKNTDPLLQEQWGFERIGASRVYSELQALPTSIVAVVDSGIDFTHPDLKDVVWENEGEIPNNGLDDDGNGYVDDRYGIDVATRRVDPVDGFGHGTHIAGIIGALPLNGVGIRGLVPNVKIVTVKIFDDKGVGSLAGAIEALEYVEGLRQRGVPIRAVNGSWGGGGPSEELKRVIDRLGELGVIFSAAAGNEGVDVDEKPQYPASFTSSNVIAVASLNEAGKRSSFSNYGRSSVDLAAPGEGVVSTVPGGDYAYYAGTSMAAPFVTSAVALVSAKYPTLTVAEIIGVIRDGAKSSTSLLQEITSGGELSLLSLFGNLSGVGLCNDSTCAEPAVTLNRLFFGEKRKGGVRKLKEVSPGAPIEVVVRGNGSGQIPVRLAVNGRSCSSAVTVSVEKGSGSLSLNTSKSLSFYEKLSVESMGRVSSISIKKSRTQSLRRARAIGVRSICHSLIRRSR